MGGCEGVFSEQEPEGEGDASCGQNLACGDDAQEHAAIIVAQDLDPDAQKRIEQKTRSGDLSFLSFPRAHQEVFITFGDFWLFA